jgi:hypothetical protein
VSHVERVLRSVGSTRNEGRRRHADGIIWRSALGWDWDLDRRRRRRLATARSLTRLSLHLSDRTRRKFRGLSFADTLERRNDLVKNFTKRRTGLFSLPFFFFLFLFFFLFALLGSISNRTNFCLARRARVGNEIPTSLSGFGATYTAIGAYNLFADPITS